MKLSDETEMSTPVDDPEKMFSLVGHRRIQFNNLIANEKFTNNKISTTKYTPLSFVPLFLWDQFSKPANFYFLIISSLQQIEGLSPTGRWGTLLPLLLSLIFSAGKEILEDLSRAKEDESINRCKVLVVDEFDLEGQTTSIDLEKLTVGRIVRVLQDELIPADLVLLKSSESEGLCYLETAAIDGETNLKLRQALSSTCNVRLWNAAEIACDAPNNEIYSFHGSLKVPSLKNLLSLDRNQFLPRGSFLVNTEWILGVVVYTGTDTKIMQNVKDTCRRKVTKMDKLNDIQNAQIVAILFVLVAFLFAGHVYFNTSVLPHHWYLQLTQHETNLSLVWSYFEKLITFILLLNNLVPISLSVTLEFVRTILAKLINNDLDMYDEELQIPSKAQSSNVLDELGRIEYIMTDKTGTLTCNQMNLKALMINGKIYKNCLSAENPLFKAVETAELVQTFLEFVCLCHTVMIDKRNGSLQASSPDELALLKASSKLGIAFASRTSERIEVKLFDGISKIFQVPAIIEFTSERKRMSVVIFDEATGKYFLVMKGAESVVLPLCSDSIESAEQCVEEFSSEGLRTLCFASKELQSAEFEAWHERWKQAINTIGPQRQDLLDSCVESIESGLNFVGVSGIEDRLQAGVPETISTLLAANIKIWILTGDRAETAVNTACLSGILKSHHRLIKLDKPECLHGLIASPPASDEAFVLLVSGDAFAHILNDRALRAAFLPISERARALISCRLSPLQKTEITHFVQNDLGKTTLAVGDGGNDVGMILAADVGVGINGLEGTQAARSSDFSIAKFRFLAKLLLVHGAWSFHRISRVILYMMYKNFVLVLCQFWYAFFNSFSSQSIFNSSLLILFNSLFSLAPPVIIGISDQYVTAPELLKHPQLYQFGQKGKFYDQKAFWECIANAAVQSFTACACFYLLIQVDPVFRTGSPLSLHLIGDIFYFIILTIISLKVTLFTNFFTRIMGIALISALLLCLLLIALRTSSAVFLSLLVPSTVVLVAITTLLRDFVWKFYKRQFKPRAYHIVQEMRAVQNRRDRRQTRKAKGQGNGSGLLTKSSSSDSETAPLKRI